MHDISCLIRKVKGEKGVEPQMTYISSTVVSHTQTAWVLVIVALEGGNCRLTYDRETESLLYGQCVSGAFTCAVGANANGVGVNIGPCHGPARGSSPRWHKFLFSISSFYLYLQHMRSLCPEENASPCTAHCIVFAR